jgi:hypothetical protein
MKSSLRTSSTYLMLLALVPAGYAAAATLDESDAASPKELSVAPLDHVVYPESRPNWLSDPLDDEAFRVVVVSGPCETVEESLEELRLMQRAAVSTLVTQIAASDGQFDFYHFDDEKIEQEHVIRSYAGELTKGGQPRYEHAAELAFSKAQRQQVQEAWQNIEVRDRLGAMGVVSFSGLVVLICGSAVTGLFSRRKLRREKVSP